jgi:hypothetical protein
VYIACILYIWIYMILHIVEGIMYYKYIPFWANNNAFLHNDKYIICICVHQCVLSLVFPQTMRLTELFLPCLGLSPLHLSHSPCPFAFSLFFSWVLELSDLWALAHTAPHAGSASLHPICLLNLFTFRDSVWTSFWGSFPWSCYHLGETFLTTLSISTSVPWPP